MLVFVLLKKVTTKLKAKVFFRLVVWVRNENIESVKVLFS